MNQMKTEAASRPNGFFRLFLRHKMGRAGLTGVVVFCLLALAAPLFGASPAGYGAAEDVLCAPGSAHPFGTDAMGLDVLGEVIWGARTSLRIGAIVVAYAVVIGVPVGLLAGYLRGWPGQLLMALTDLFLTLPMLPLMIMMASLLGASLSNIAFVIGVLSWPRVARVTYAATLEANELQYVETARCLGVPPGRIVLRHILRYVLPLLLVEMTMLMASAILAESGISFLGLGDPAAWSWGKILQRAQKSGILFRAWWCTLFPSAFITLFVISFNFLGVGIRDTLNPRLRGR